MKFMPELNFNWNPVTFRVLGVVFSTSVHEIVLINYENKLSEIRKLLNTWSRRNITTFGKITVIKTMVISKITYLFMNLPDPDGKFLHIISCGMVNKAKSKDLVHVRTIKLGVYRCLMSNLFVSSENKLAETHPI